MFLHLSVSHSVHRGGLPQCMLGYTPLSRHPLLGRRLLLRTVRILLECILVFLTLAANGSIPLPVPQKMTSRHKLNLLHNMYVHWRIKSPLINVSCFMLFRSVQHTSGVVTGQSRAKSQEIEIYLSSGSKGAPGMHTPSPSNVFHFHAVFENIWPNNWLVPSSLELAPLWKILDPHFM